VFDGADPDGRPLVRRPPLDPAELRELSLYLQNAPMLTVPGDPGPDLLDPRRGLVVPQTWHTDGDWVWSGSVIYYLHVHGLAPQPELLAHLRRQRFVLGPVSEQARERALAVVNGTPIPTPRPPVEDVPASDEPGRAVPDEPAAPEPRPPADDADQPVDQPADQPVDQPADQPVGQSAGLSADPESAPEPEAPRSSTPGSWTSSTESDPELLGPDSPELVAALRQAADAAADLGIDPDRFRIDGVRDDAWCLSRDGHRWRVFQQRGASRKGAEFDTVHEAVTFFVGHLYLHRLDLQAPHQQDAELQDASAPDDPAQDGPAQDGSAQDGSGGEAAQPAVPPSSDTPAVQAGQSAGDHKEFSTRSRDSSTSSDAASPVADEPSRAPSTVGAAARS
jgi:hypothetical protein